MSDSGELTGSDDYQRPRSRSRHSARRRTRRSPSPSPSRSRSRSGSGSQSEGQDDPSPEQALQEVNELLQAGVIKFCSEHNTDLVPDTCVACRAVSRMVKPAMLEQLVRLGGKEVVAA